MYFQVNVTPKAKVVERIDCEKPENQFSLLLAPFQPQTRITIKSVINVPSQCYLNIRNTSLRPLSVIVTKEPPEERCITLNLSEFVIEAESTVVLCVTWLPKEVGTWRDTLQLTDSRRIKYDVPILTSATDSRKPGNGDRKREGVRVLSRLSGNAAGNPSRIRRQQPIKTLPIQRLEAKRTLSTSDLAIGNTNPKTKRLKSDDIFETHDKENISINIKSSWSYERSSYKKESCEGSHDFSAIIKSETFNLTPVCSKFKSSRISFSTKTTEKMNFPSQPASLTSLTNVETVPLRRETFVTTPKCRQIPIITHSDENDKTEFEDSLSPQPTVDENDFSALCNEMNFSSAATPVAAPRHSNFSPNSCSTGGKSTAESIRLSTDKSLTLFPEHDTFDITPAKSCNSSIVFENNGTFELAKSPTSSNNFRHLRSTRLSGSFAMLSPVMPIIGQDHETNLPSSSPICSAHLPGDGDVSKKDSLRLSLRTPDTKSAQQVVEADMWVKPSHCTVASNKSRYANLEMILEEHSVVDKEQSTNKTYTKQLNKTDVPRSYVKQKSPSICMEISPPRMLKGVPSRKVGPTRRVSPTKYRKISKEKNVQDTSALRKKVQLNRSIKTGTNVTIPGVRITRLSLAGLKKKALDRSLKSSTKEVSVKLHNPNDFLTRYCNVDPFGATITEDPFLTSTLYYDEKWIYHQETEFKKWLNALLTPPEHLSSDVDSTCIDVGKVWQSCRMKEDVALAETRETVSARYHTNTRLNTLRKAACAMFRSNEVSTVLARVTVCVEKGILLVKQDRDLYRDIGLQKEILELFLSYNPLWLRIGLEVVYGETIPLHSNNDLVGLTRFLLTRFFSDPFLVKTHSHPSVINLTLPSFMPLMNKFMLKKFLLIVYFLDIAKRNKLIGHDPCLFHKRAPHKDSRSILLTFSREVLSGIGDVTRLLRPYGYVLQHKQTYLDEYDYAVVDLCTDLRDGVRLCRVMELITGNRNLTCRCRVPAISRLQKVHNVDIALITLLQYGYTLTGGIDAKSVADGHREKTLSLLWQIIYKFQAPRFEKAASTVQRWWRSKLWYVRVRYFLRQRREKAATVIQRSWRCFTARRELQRLKEEHVRVLKRKNEAIRVIQLRWLHRKRMVLERRSFLRLKTSTVTLQRWWRRMIATRSFVKDFQKKKRAIVILQQRWRVTQLAKRERERYLQKREIVMKIQSLWRAKCSGRIARAEYQRTKTAIVFIQRKWRATRSMKAERERYQKKLNAAKVLQTWWRNILTAKRDRKEFLLMKYAVRTIEEWWIRRISNNEDRKVFLLQRESAIKIQRKWRRYRITKHEVMQLRVYKTTCVRIQSWWRCAITSREYNRKRNSCLKIQQWWQSITLMRSTRESYLITKRSAIVIQKNWRMLSTRRAYLRKKAAVLSIESWYSNIVASRKVRNDFLRKKIASKTIQYWLRNLKFSKRHRYEYLKYKRAVIQVQSRWRAKLLFKKIRSDYLSKKRAALRIQSWWRLVRERRSFLILLKQHRAARVLQRKWRATLIAREEHSHYVKLRSSAIVVQRNWRGMRVARLMRREFILRRSAAITIQKNWRAFLMSRRYRKQKCAACVIQSWWRIIRERRSFLILLKQHRAARVLQRKWRATLIARKEHSHYVKLRSSAIVVQRNWRGMRVTRLMRREFILRRSAAITIQKNWRAFLMSRRYRKQKCAAYVIQSWWRNSLSATKTRNQFLALKNATIFLQRHYRRNTIVRRTREQYIELRRNTIILQRKWRATMIMRRIREKFLTWHYAVLVIQSTWRMTVERKKYMTLKRTATTIQSLWRSKKLARNLRTRFLLLRSAAITVQRRYRANKLRDSIRRDYLVFRRNAVFVQCKWRFKLLARNRARVESAKEHEAATRIQYWWKRIVRERREAEYQETRKIAVSIIEYWWINKTVARRLALNEERLLLKKQTSAATLIQATWKGYRIRKSQCAKMTTLRQRIEEATKTAVPSATLAHRFDEAIDIFQNCTSLGALSRCMTLLDVIVRLSPNGCTALCKADLVDNIYNVLAQSNRSLPWMDVCLPATSILITLAKFRTTKRYACKAEYGETIARLLTSTLDRENKLFLHLATLLWSLSEDSEYAKEIVKSSRIIWLLSSLYTSVTKKRSRRSTTLSAKSKEPHMHLLPNPKPDWGLVQKRPRLFTDVHHAVVTIIKRLDINVVS